MWWWVTFKLHPNFQIIPLDMVARLVGHYNCTKNVNNDMIDITICNDLFPLAASIMNASSCSNSLKQGNDIWLIVP